MSGKFALIIGNTEYSDPGLAQLTAPGMDAKDFARVLQSKDICDFDDVQISLNQPSTSVIAAIDEFFDQRKPDDLLVLYFSGHGVKDEIGSLYLAFKNTVRSRLRSSAIKSDYIREAMDQSRSKRQVLILDCCNSGAFPQGTKAELGGAMGMVRIFQGYGRFVLTASDSTQFAWEGDKVIGETDNSLFTHFLIKGLEGEADNDGDGRITVDELYDYAYGEVSKVTPKQTPTKSSSKQEGEIILRENMRIEDIKPVPLPTPLLDSIENPFSDVRFGAVQQLTKLLNGKNLGLARSAKEALERVAENDDSRQVSRAAFQALETVRQAEQKVEEERKAAEGERQAMLKAEEERLTAAKEETERKAREEAQRLAVQQAEEVRLVREKAEAEHKAKEEAERLVAQKAEEKRIAVEKAERLLAEQKAEKERIAKVKAEADSLAQEKVKAEADKLTEEKLKTTFEKERFESEAIKRPPLDEEKGLADQKTEKKGTNVERLNLSGVSSLPRQIITSTPPPTPKWTSVFWIAVASGIAWRTLWSMLDLLNLYNMDSLINTNNTMHGLSLADGGIGIVLIPIFGALVINGLITIYILFINNIFPSFLGIFLIILGWVIGGLLSWILNVILFIFFIDSNLIFTPMFIAGAVSGAIGGFFLIWRIREEKRIR
jgi:hypothetical protein